MKPRVYLDAPLERPGEVSLDEAPAHHLARVLRLREGDALTVFNGRGGEWDARSSSASGACARGFDATSSASRPCASRWSRACRPAIAWTTPCKRPSSLVWRRSSPCSRKKGVVRLKGIRASARVDHWKRLPSRRASNAAATAFLKCCRSLDFDQYRPDGDGTRLLLSAQGKSIREIKWRVGATIAAGPEAGFAPEEQAALERAGFVKASLGPRVLRTETAALAALAALNALRGDF